VLALQRDLLTPTWSRMVARIRKLRRHLWTGRRESRRLGSAGGTDEL